MADSTQTDAATQAAAYEKLGAFYLGRGHDLESGETSAEPVLYDSRDLTTHAVCVGMTGSGKTGLCVGLLEEAAMDGVPAIAIDPKGDLGNLLLTFPELRPEDFRPWIDEGAAARKSMSPDEFAAGQAELWKNGLAEWGQDGDRIRRLREKADLSIYTPGSTAGRPLAVLKSLDAPAKKVRDDAEALRDKVISSASGLLALAGEDTDPVQSRAHILVSTILQHAWQQGRSVSLAQLIGWIQSPPFEKVGVLDLETFMPTKDRGKLAMKINNLLASPGFGSWLEGEPMDVGRLLHTKEGKPRVSVISIAHLPEAQRMFFVTLLLNEVVAWMRAQPGTSSLRAIIYMDEVFGYFPPSAEPPSKRPLLTLMKQARAYGVGCVLATQNPVDLDYKGLSNAGTWLLGRLQTERDKARVLEGLEGAAGTFDKQAMERTLAGLGKRVFLLHNVHEKKPVTFRTRWVMSYLRGPLTREQIKQLTPSAVSDEGTTDASAKSAPAPVGAGGAAAPQVVARDPVEDVVPALPAEANAGYLPIAERVERGDRIVYQPFLVGSAPLHYVRVSAKVDDWHDTRLLAPAEEGSRWSEATPIPAAVELDDDPDGRAGPVSHAEPEAEAQRSKSYAKWRKALIDHHYRESAKPVWHCKALKAYSELGVTEADFRVRLAELAREARDDELEEVKTKYGKKLKTLEDRLRRAEDKIEVEEAQFKRSGLDTAVSIGATILGAFLGRKKISATNVRRAGTSASRASRTAKEKGDIARAKEAAQAVREQIAALEAEFEGELDRVKEEHDPDTLEVTEIVLAPRKTDMAPASVRLAWAPFAVDSDGIARAVFEQV